MNRKASGDEPMEAAASAIGHLYEAKERLKDAASAAGTVMKNVAANAVSESRERIGEPLADARDATAAAAERTGHAVSAEFDVLVDRGKQLWSSAEDLIRKRPVAAFGTAFAVGWLIAKLARRR
jgi:ElaB/YqjD/DUF883 family membrane-anchored ribosome-binding protein